MFHCFQMMEKNIKKYIKLYLNKNEFKKCGRNRNLKRSRSKREGEKSLVTGHEEVIEEK